MSGIFLSPFGNGVFLLVIWIIIYEILYYLASRYFGRHESWFCHNRVGIAMASILGWIIGRTLLNKEVMQIGYCPVAMNNHDGPIGVYHDHIIMRDGSKRPRK